MVVGGGSASCDPVACLVDNIRALRQGEGQKTRIGVTAWGRSPAPWDPDVGTPEGAILLPVDVGRSVLPRRWGQPGPCLGQRPEPCRRGQVPWPQASPQLLRCQPRSRASGRGVWLTPADGAGGRAPPSSSGHAGFPALWGLALPLRGCEFPFGPPSLHTPGGYFKTEGLFS